MGTILFAVGLLLGFNLARAVAMESIQAELRCLDSGELSKARAAGHRARLLFVLLGQRQLHAMADCGLARAHLIEGDYVQALQMFRRWLDKRSSLRIHQYFHLVNCAIEALISAGQYQEAIEVLASIDEQRWKEARSLQTVTWEVPKINGAEALFEMGRTGDAYALLDEWGDALAALGKPDAAAQAWRLVLERDPQSVAARTAQERLPAGLPQVQPRSPEAAESARGEPTRSATRP